MSEENRVDTMAVKLAARAQRAGIVADVLTSGYRLSVDKRLRVLGDVFHPDLLHPARTALILLEDAGCQDDVLLTAATLIDSEFPELRVDGSAVRAVFGERVADLVAAVPMPAEAGEALLEELVSVPHDVGLMAVAERLDHARHLHFRDAGAWRAFYAQITDAYLPFSGRVSAPLATRLSRWSTAFAKRLSKR
ncbi:MAG: hypothetical protein ACT4O1_10035 [Gemmatimonadota bacterium]